ncbi:MAG: transcription-repair coupling factor [Planctomycetota bacterium]
MQPLVDQLLSDATTARVLEALRSDRRADVGGVWGGFASLLASAVSRSLDRRLLVVTAGPDEAAQRAEELRLFFPKDAGEPVDELPATDRFATEDRNESLERLAVLDAWRRPGGPRVLVAPILSLLQAVPVSERDGDRRSLTRGGTLDRDALAQQLTQAGFEPVEAVVAPWQFSVRGDILDVFAPPERQPVRIELFDDEIESLRLFDPLTQVSSEERTSIELVVWRPDAKVAPAASASPLTALGTDVGLVEIEPEHIRAEIDRLRSHAPPEASLLAAWDARRETTAFAARLSALPIPKPGAIHFRVLSTGELRGTRDELPGTIRRLAEQAPRMTIFCPTRGDRRHLHHLLKEKGLLTPSVELARGTLTEGFRWPDVATVVNYGELLPKAQTRPIRRRSQKQFEGEAIDHFLDLAPGDTVVHLSHGIARFHGMKRLPRQSGNGEEEFLILEFADDVKVYVPVSKIDLVQRYIGSKGATPRLSKVGGKLWSQRKKAAESAVEDLASELLEVQAMREKQPGISCPPDDEQQREFELAFPYEPTPDQKRAIEDIKRDLESSRPMDRLLCGDVGHGKTEVALRAAFKIIMSGRQVAVLVPTTVLAQQHWRTFTERLSDYPVTIEVLSRFRTKGEQKKVLDHLASGGVDVVIGTHRLVQRDVSFQNLGLVIIDEEQRFGVAAKERLKRLRATVDVLTMTATPIPRTLHMSLLGLRDISTLEQAPFGRHAVRTRISHFDEETIKESLYRELERDGQVFFVHNRVLSIERMKQTLEGLVPEARIAVAHGQMEEGQLERVMIEFLEGRVDVLVSTTIIESGLDIPRANTLIVDRADRFGLAELHQLRGRVGRADRQAYATFFIPADTRPSEVAAKRLKAIEELDYLGAGFALAMKDLEIRGAGNLLGAQQHGHIAAVGYDLYCRLLSGAVRRMRNERVDEVREVDLEVGIDAYLPEDWVTDLRSRLRLYRRLNRCRKDSDFEKMRLEMRDRFGPLPETVGRLLELMRLKAACLSGGVSRVSYPGEDRLILQLVDQGKQARWIDPNRREQRRITPDRLELVLPANARDSVSATRFLTTYLSASSPKPESRPRRTRTQR